MDDVKGYALLDTGASRSVGGYMMVQYVIDCLSRNTAPPWLESADPAVSFTFPGGEEAHSETRIWLPLPGTRQERLAVHGHSHFALSGHASRIWPCDKCGPCVLLQYEVAVLPSRHLALALTPSGNVETTREMTTLADETDADMAAAVQEDHLE